MISCVTFSNGIADSVKAWPGGYKPFITLRVSPAHKC